MQIRESSKEISLYRYGGKVGDKQLEVKIATIDPSTKPDAISPGVVEQLTPLELAQLKGYLRTREGKRNKDVAESLATGIAQLGKELAGTKLDSDAAKALLEACKRIKGPLERSIAQPPTATAAPEKTGSAAPDGAQSTQQEPTAGDTQVAIDKTAVEPPREATESN